MTRYKMEDGTVVDTSNAKQDWKEDRQHDGRNWISVATGSQFAHERLYMSRKGRYYIERTSDYQGSRASAEWISKRTAAAWLLTNDHAIPADLASAADDVSE